MHCVMEGREEKDEGNGTCLGILLRKHGFEGDLCKLLLLVWVKMNLAISTLNVGKGNIKVHELLCNCIAIPCSKNIVGS